MSAKNPKPKAKRQRSGRIQIAKFVNVKGSFQCRWNECVDTAEDISSFYSHLKQHILSRLSTDTGLCQWRGCESQSTWTATHLYYHGYHEKLKVNGDQKLKSKNVQCSYPPERRHTVDVFEVFDCEWTDCVYVLQGPDEFNFHLLGHALDTVEESTDQSKTFTCGWQNCGQEFSLRNFKQHVKTHTSEKDSACSHCGSIFRSANKFLDHFRRQTGTTEESHECRYCNKKITDERLLRDHERGHISHYKCPLCDMTMPSPNDVRNHIAARHTTGRPYACSQCPSRFKLPRNLSTHIERVHNTKDITCTDCDFVTRSHYRMRRHRLTCHDGSSRVYACHLCTARFDIEGHLLSRHLVSVHQLQWPSGHRRFHYVRDRDGVFRLQTFRYESAELVEIVPDGVDIENVIEEEEEEEDDDDEDDEGVMRDGSLQIHEDNSDTEDPTVDSAQNEVL